MTVEEWLATVEAQLKRLPLQRRLSQLVPIVCEGCMTLALATYRDENGEWCVDGWRRRDDLHSSHACSIDCATDASALAVRKGEQRPRWVLTVCREG